MVRSKQLSNSKKLIVNSVIDLILNHKFSHAQVAIKKNFKPGSYFNSFLNGWIQQLKGNHDKAIKLFEKALLENPLSEDCLNGLAASYLELKQLTQAEECAEHGLFVNPNSDKSKYIFATILATKYKKNVDKQQKALSLFEEVLSSSVDRTLINDCMIGIGAVLLDLDQVELAKKYLEMVVKTDVYNPVAHKNLISVYSNLLEIDNAISSAKIAQMVDNAEAHSDAMYQEGMLELLKENFSRGWRLHEARLSSSRASQILTTGLPIWQGQALLPEEHLLVTHEQGLGDLLHFLRYLPEIKKLCPNVSLEIRPNTFISWSDGEPPSFKYFLEKYIEVDNILIRGWNKVNKEKYSYVLPIMSSPKTLKLQNSIPKPIQFGIQADNPKWDIAICWQGSKHHFNDSKRSLPFELIEQLIKSNKNLKFISLQSAYNNDSIENLTADPSLVDSIDKTLDVILNSKYVITVDSMIAHLSGGTNVPVFVMQPYSPDWRWGLTREDCLWYDNITNIRQTSINNWDDVITKLNNKLSQI